MQNFFIRPEIFPRAAWLFSEKRNKILIIFKEDNNFTSPLRHIKKISFKDWTIGSKNCTQVISFIIAANYSPSIIDSLATLSTSGRLLGRIECIRSGNEWAAVANIAVKQLNVELVLIGFRVHTLMPLQPKYNCESYQYSKCWLYKVW